MACLHPPLTATVHPLDISRENIKIVAQVCVNGHSDLSRLEWPVAGKTNEKSRQKAQWIERLSALGDRKKASLLLETLARRCLRPLG